MHTYTRISHATLFITHKSKDTIYDTASLDVATLREVKLDELPKTTGIVVVNSLSITKSFHDRTARGENIILQYFYSQ